MKKHKWKYDPDIGEKVCVNCGIAKMKDVETREIIYVDFTTESYLRDSTWKRPECTKKINNK